jgi:hypothetical protein
MTCADAPSLSSVVDVQTWQIRGAKIFETRSGMKEARET